MYCTYEDQRLYLPAGEYNAARVLEYLLKIVENNGGEYEPYKHTLANNRSYEPNAEPKRIMGQLWADFILDDVYYGISLDDNPFFDFYLTKTQVVDGKRKRNVYTEKLSKEWVYDCLFRVTNDEEVKEIAYQLFNIVVKAPMSEVYNDKHRFRVNNIYDGGWHWEYKVDPDRWIKAKWDKY